MKFIIAILCIWSANISFAQSWTQLGTGIHGLNHGSQIYALCTDRMNNIYAAGTLADDSLRMNVFKWDGADWQELGGASGALNNSAPITTVFADTSGNVFTAVRIDSLYPRGLWTVMKWDGSAWSQLGIGTSALYAHGGLSSIIMDRTGNLYAAGGYQDSSTGGYYVAKWDGTSWTELGTGAARLHANSYINSLAIDTFGNIYAAGDFTDGATDTAGNLYVAKWDGTHWTEMGSGITPAISYDLHIFSLTADPSGNIYAAGYFWNDSNKCFVAKWDGSSWNELGSGSHALKANDAIMTTCMDIHGNLYCAGYFTDSTSPLSGQNYVAKWDGATWTNMGNDFHSIPSSDKFIGALCGDADGNLYAGGDFVDTTVLVYADTVLFPWDSLPYHPVYVAKYSRPTSVSHLHGDDEITAFPNPVHSTINVRINSAALIAEDRAYFLYDVTGKCVRTGKMQTTITKINVEDLPEGIYFLQLENHPTAYRMVKQ